MNDIKQMKNDLKKYIIIIVSVVLIVGGGVLLYFKNKDNKEETKEIINRNSSLAGKPQGRNFFIHK